MKATLLMILVMILLASMLFTDSHQTLLGLAICTVVAMLVLMLECLKNDKNKY